VYQMDQIAGMGQLERSFLVDEVSFPGEVTGLWLRWVGWSSFCGVAQVACERCSYL
jgi:hypothetical protein